MVCDYKSVLVMAGPDDTSAEWFVQVRSEEKKASRWGNLAAFELKHK